MATEKTRLIPITDWHKHHPWPPIGGLRNMRFFSDQNGFAKAFVKVGRRVLVDEQQFFEAVRRQQQTERKAA